MRKEENRLCNCPDCNVEPGTPHLPGCDVERCSACGGQRLQCECKGHDLCFARWTGIWPGGAEAAYLGIGLNLFIELGLAEIFFQKPKSRKGE